MSNILKAIALLEGLQPTLNQRWDIEYKSKVTYDLQTAIKLLIEHSATPQPITWSVEECVYMVGAINGVLTVPDRLLANIYAESEFSISPSGLSEKLQRLTPSEVETLYHRLYAFWETDNNHIESTLDRLKSVGLIKE